MSATPAWTDGLPRLRAALHTRIKPPFAGGLADWLERAERAGELAGGQLAAAIASQGRPPELTLVASTLLDPGFTLSAAAVHRFTRAFEAASGQRVQGLVNAYLCASWGFALRHAIRHSGARRLGLAIVDLDLHDVDWHREHPVIGRSGFGYSSLVLDLPAAGAPLPECGGPFANSAFGEFVMALRAHRGRHGVHPTFLPFTKPQLHGIAERVLGADTLEPNRYPTWGHCFGSDPWIGLIEWLQKGSPPAAATPVLTGGIGFNGYYTVSALLVEPGLASAFDVLQGGAVGPPRATPPHLPLPVRAAAPAVRQRIPGATTP